MQGTANGTVKDGKRHGRTVQTGMQQSYFKSFHEHRRNDKMGDKTLKQQQMRQVLTYNVQA